MQICLTTGDSFLLGS